MKPCLSAFILLISLFSFNAYGAINKWVDDNGQVHYSDQAPPQDTQSTTLGKTTAASDVAASDASAPKTLAEREADLKKSRKAKAEAAEKAAKQQSEAEAKQKYCLEVRGSLKSLEDRPRIATYDANGELIYMDDDARQQRIQEAREAIETNCN